MKKYHYESRKERYLSKDFKELRNKLKAVSMNFLLEDAHLFKNFEYSYRSQVSYAFAEFLLISEEVGMLAPSYAQHINQLRELIIDELLEGKSYTLVRSLTSVEFTLNQVLDSRVSDANLLRKFGKDVIRQAEREKLCKLKTASLKAQQHNNVILTSANAIAKLNSLYEKLNRCTEDKVAKLLIKVQKQQELVNNLVLN